MDEDRNSGCAASAIVIGICLLVLVVISAMIRFALL